MISQVFKFMSLVVGSIINMFTEILSGLGYLGGFIAFFTLLFAIKWLIAPMFGTAGSFRSKKGAGDD